MNSIKFAQALLDSIVSSGAEYSPVVFICKNAVVSKSLIDKFKNTCKETGIDLIDGYYMIANSDISLPKSTHACVLLEDLQLIIGNTRLEQNFFDLFNVLWENHCPILITLDQELKHLHFEERNKSRFHYGMIHSIE